MLEADGQISRAKGRRSRVAEPKFRWEATIGARSWRQQGSPGLVTLGCLVDTRRVLAGGHVGQLLGLAAADGAERLRSRPAGRVGRQPRVLLSSLDLDGDDTPVCFARTVIRGDKFRFSLSLRQQHTADAAMVPNLLTYLS